MALSEDLMKAAGPALSAAASDMVDGFLTRSEALIFSGVDTARVEAALTDAAKFRALAIRAASADEARDYADASETALRRAKTLALAEGVATSESAAEAIKAGFGAVLDAIGSVGKGLVVAIAEGIASGAVKGLTGGDGGGGFDPSSIFPNA